jgi:hypothetical protein
MGREANTELRGLWNLQTNAPANYDRLRKKSETAFMNNKRTTYKQDVALSLANALMCLGKNQHERVRHYIERSRQDLEDWLRERPEKTEKSGD